MSREHIQPEILVQPVPALVVDAKEKAPVPASQAPIDLPKKSADAKEERIDDELITKLKLPLARLMVLEIQSKLGKGGLTGALSNMLTKLMFFAHVDIDSVHFTEKGTNAIGLAVAALLSGRMDPRIYFDEAAITSRNFEPVPAPVEHEWGPSGAQAKFSGYPSHGDNYKLGVNPMVAIGRAIAYKKSGIKKPVIVNLCEGDLGPGGADAYARVASQLQLDNLVLMIDVNGLGSAHSSEDFATYNLEEGFWREAGWEALSIDQTKPEHLNAAFQKMGKVGKPLIVLCGGAPKGWGIPALERNPRFNHRLPTEFDYQKIIYEQLRICYELIMGKPLPEIREDENFVKNVKAALIAFKKDLVASPLFSKLFPPFKPLDVPKRPTPQLPVLVSPLEVEAKRTKGATADEMTEIAIRWTKEFERANGELIVLGTDNLIPWGFDNRPPKLDPAEIKPGAMGMRYYTPGVAEALVGYMLLGMASEGQPAVYSGPSVHMVDLVEPLKMASLCNIPMIILSGNSGGLSMSHWGGGHHNMRPSAYSFENCHVFEPSNPVVFDLILRNLHKNVAARRASFVNYPMSNCSYVPHALARAGVEELNNIFDRGFYVADSSNDNPDTNQVVIIATGQSMKQAQEACAGLRAEGINFTLIEVFNISHVDKNALTASIAGKKPAAIFTMTESNGDDFATLVRKAVPEKYHKKIIAKGVDTHFNFYGTPDEMRKYFRLDGGTLLEECGLVFFKKSFLKKDKIKQLKDKISPSQYEKLMQIYAKWKVEPTTMGLANSREKKSEAAEPECNNPNDLLKQMLVAAGLSLESAQKLLQDDSLMSLTNKGERKEEKAEEKQKAEEKIVLLPEAERIPVAERNIPGKEEANQNALADAHKRLGLGEVVKLVGSMPQPQGRTREPYCQVIDDKSKYSKFALRERPSPQFMPSPISAFYTMDGQRQESRILNALEPDLEPCRENLGLSNFELVLTSEDEIREYAKSKEIDDAAVERLVFRQKQLKEFYDARNNYRFELAGRKFAALAPGTPYFTGMVLFVDIRGNLPSFIREKNALPEGEGREKKAYCRASDDLILPKRAGFFGKSWESADAEDYIMRRRRDLTLEEARKVREKIRGEMQHLGGNKSKVNVALMLHFLKEANQNDVLGQNSESVITDGMATHFQCFNEKASGVLPVFKANRVKINSPQGISCYHLKDHPVQSYLFSFKEINDKVIRYMEEIQNNFYELMKQVPEKERCEIAPVARKTKEGYEIVFMLRKDVSHQQALVDKTFKELLLEASAKGPAIYNRRPGYLELAGLFLHEDPLVFKRLNDDRISQFLEEYSASPSVGAMFKSLVARSTVQMAVTGGKREAKIREGSPCSPSPMR